MLPREVDDRLTEDPLSLPHIRRSIPRECLEVSAVRSWGALLRVITSSLLFMVILANIHPESRWSLALLWQIPALIALWLACGWSLVGLFVLGHDCGHRSFSRRKWVNTVVGHLCLSPLANGYHAWRLTHDHHHAFTQLRGQDIDWASFLSTRQELAAAPRTLRGTITRIGYALPFGVFFWIWWNSMARGVAIRSQLSARVYEREKWRLRLSSLVTVGALLLIYGSLYRYAGFWGMMKLYGVPAWIAMATGWVIIAIQHGNEDSLLYEENAWTPAKGQVVSTFDTRFPRVLELAWCKINFHVPHHVAPGIPWYNLETAAAALKAAYPEYYQDRRFRLSDLMVFYRTPVLQRDEAKGFFTYDATWGIATSAPRASHTSAGT